MEDYIGTHMEELRRQNPARNGGSPGSGASGSGRENREDEQLRRRGSKTKIVDENPSSSKILQQHMELQLPPSIRQPSQTQQTQQSQTQFPHQQTERVKRPVAEVQAFSECRVSPGLPGLAKKPRF